MMPRSTGNHDCITCVLSNRDCVSRILRYLHPGCTLAQVNPPRLYLECFWSLLYLERWGAGLIYRRSPTMADYRKRLLAESACGSAAAHRPPEIQAEFRPDSKISQLEPAAAVEIPAWQLRLLAKARAKNGTTAAAEQSSDEKIATLSLTIDIRTSDASAQLTSKIFEGSHTFDLHQRCLFPSIVIENVISNELVQQIWSSVVGHAHLHGTLTLQVGRHTRVLFKTVSKPCGEATFPGNLWGREVFRGPNLPIFNVSQFRELQLSMRAEAFTDVESLHAAGRSKATINLKGRYDNDGHDGRFDGEFCDYNLDVYHTEVSQLARCDSLPEMIYNEMGLHAQLCNLGRATPVDHDGQRIIRLINDLPTMVARSIICQIPNALESECFRFVLQLASADCTHTLKTCVTAAAEDALYYNQVCSSEHERQSNVEKAFDDARTIRNKETHCDVNEDGVFESVSDAGGRISLNCSTTLTVLRASDQAVACVWKDRKFTQWNDQDGVSWTRIQQLVDLPIDSQGLREEPTFGTELHFKGLFNSIESMNMAEDDPLDQDACTHRGWTSATDVLTSASCLDMAKCMWELDVEDGSHEEYCDSAGRKWMRDLNTLNWQI